MTSPTRNLSKKLAFLPPGVGLFARRRFSEFVGLGFGLLALALFAALASYDPGDPSINTAVRAIPQNWMGMPGAWIADLMIQSMGLASWLIGPVFIAWGWRLLVHRGLGRVWLRITATPMTLLLAAMGLSVLPTVGGWPLGAGLGGVTGDILLNDLAGLFAGLNVSASVIGAISGIGAVVAGATAMGLSAAEWRGMARGLGGLLRVILFRGRQSVDMGLKAADAGGQIIQRGKDILSRGRARVEPHFDGQSDEFNEIKAPIHDGGARKAPRPLRDVAAGAPNKPVVTPRSKRAATGKREAADRQARLVLEPGKERILPPLDILNPSPVLASGDVPDKEALEQNARLLETVLDDFGVRGQIVKVRPGPVVTLYELEPAPGTKSSRVIGLADDIARSMSAVSVRVAVIPGRNVIGIELPNVQRELVSLRELLSSAAYERTAGQLTLALGKDIGGAPVLVDLARMPHLLIAGTTGSGKSVAINTMILSLLYRMTPEQCRLIMIDPKMLELSVYDGIPHLLSPVVTDPSKAVVALRWAVREMEDRYRAMSNLGVRNIAGYNARLVEAKRQGETLTRTVQTGFDRDSGQPVYEEQELGLEPLPFIVVVVDEMADLMLIAGKDVEASVQRLAQMARAAGIHLLMATQRPSVDVITGTIKANFPTRVSFQVTSKIDSRTILGEGGAEQLLGDGDMLYMAGGGRITRVHGPFVTDEEVEQVVSFLKSQGEPDFVDAITEGELQEGAPITGLRGAGGGENIDELYDQAVALVCRERKASTSFVQRHLQIGYNRAARIVERMESEGVVSAANHVGKREVLARDIDDRAH